MRPTGSLVLTPAPHAPLRSAGVTVQKAALGGARVAPRSAPARASRARDVACSAGLSGKVNKVVLAYSGGLDTSVILKWLQETYDCEVGAAPCGVWSAIAGGGGGSGARGQRVVVGTSPAIFVPSPGMLLFPVPLRLCATSPVVVFLPAAAPHNRLPLHTHPACLPACLPPNRLPLLIPTACLQVVTFTADLGQGEELEPARQKAEAAGVKDIFIDDLREEFVRDFVFPMFRWVGVPG